MSQSAVVRESGQLGSGSLDVVPPSPASPRREWLVWTQQALTVLLPIIVWFAPLGLAPLAQHGLAITVFMVVGWIVEVTEYAITA